ncbi:titin-like [Saccostrea cucullata]|uniref:titin-like n=1 Tax=Saccostrea cuccullata TaxID=36930 RepID=UPI002ED2C7B1
MSINETHLKDNEKLELNDLGYEWFGYNRNSKHIRAPKTFGGVGILVRKTILQHFMVRVNDKSYEELPVLRLQGASSENDEVTITYSVVHEGYQKVHSIKWTKDGNLLDLNKPKYSGGDLESTCLKILSPEENDIGEYSCEVPKLPVLRLQGASSENDEVTISYSVVHEGYQKVHSIKWTKDGNLLDLNKPKYSGGDLESTCLKILSPEEDDIGEYGCEVPSILGSVKESLTLKLPVLRLQGASSENDEVTISYSVVHEGYQKVHSIKWTKDGNLLDLNKPKYSGGDLESTCLKILSPEEDDIGEYGCEVPSILGSVKESLTLKLPVLRLQGASSENDEVTISYSVVHEGYQKVHSIKWTKDGNLLDLNKPKYSGGDLENTCLKILSPEKDDIGEYGCEVPSILGSDE